MGGILMLAGGALSLVAFVCAIIIIIDAFKNTAWKGILGFFCFPYLIYYAVVEYQSENKTLILIGYLVGLFGGIALRLMGAFMR